LDKANVELMGQAISGSALVVSAVGLVFAGLQSKSAARASDISTVHGFISQINGLWRECIDIIDREPFSHDRFNLCLSNILGQFEIAAILLLEGSSGARTSRFIEETIISYMDRMSQEGYIPYTQGMLTRPTDLEHLKDFCRQRSSLFADARLVFDMLNMNRESSS
jgi:hypothetical protein